MEMEDHHPHRQHDYVMPDLMQFMTTHPQFPAAPGGITQPAPAAELFPGHHRNCLTQQHHFEMLMMPQGLQDFADGNNNNNNNNNSTSNNNTVTASAAGVSTPSFSTGFDGEAAGGAGATAYFGGDGGNGRWPRQETLTLLEIRSRLDSKFKEANQKGPVWDEVSRVMCEEHGYQRSGKKCREKFENLYKYYKKTKEGKAGRQDGKHYRFFRQLEALCGGDHHTTNNTSPNSLQETCTHPLGISSSTTTIPFNPSITAHPHHHQELSFPSSSRQNPFVAHQNSLSLSDHNSSSGPDSLSSPSDNELSTMEITDSAEKIKWDKKKKRRSGWKAKIKEFIDLQMKKLVEKQEAWLERLTRTLELKEQERVLREEEWRRQEQARIDREHKFWAKQRAWIEARDAALMETLHTFTGIEQLKAPAVAQAADVGDDGDGKVNDGGIISNGNRWTDGEITKLIQTRTSMETRFQQQISDDDSEELALWEEVANQMIGLGFKKNASMCKNKWDWINNYKKSHNNTNYYSRSSSNCGYLQSSESFLHSQGTTSETASGASARQLLQLNHHDNINGSSSLAARAASNSNNNTSNSVSVSDSCFRFLMADNGDHHLWEGYGLKLSSLGSDHHQ